MAEDLKLAAIDIGSNAIRMQVSGVLHQKGHYFLKKLEYMRFPLRLGADVFETGLISAQKQEQFIKLMQSFSLLTELYETAEVMACATSAMREARNGQALADETFKRIGLKINIITGEQEAALIGKSLVQLIDEKHNYLHIDVGGGSTEVNLYIKRVLVASASFRSGSVRNTMQPAEAYKQMDAWLAQHVMPHYHPLIAIGTGGNISKLFELSAVHTPKSRSISYPHLLEAKEKVERMNTEERINDLMLNPDRADTIIPAGNIYLHIMRLAGAHTMLIPDLGLKDGILQTLLEKNIHLLPKL